MKYKDKSSPGHKVFVPRTPVFDVVFGCRYKVLTSLKIVAPSAEEATQIAKTVIRESRIEGPEDAPPAWINGMGTTLLTQASLISASPEVSPGMFDLKGLDIAPFLTPDKPE
jgi:hypothetical protein